MRMTSSPLHDVSQTGEAMLMFVRKWSKDIGECSDLSLEDFFRVVAELPYIPDPKGHEMLVRQKICMSSKSPSRDCDDKAILIASWLYLNYIPFRFLACSYEPNGPIAHVVTETPDGVLDPTYPSTKFPAPQAEYYNAIPICEWEPNE